MDADRLHVVACVANPIRWQSRIALFERFARHMLASGVRLYVVECAYGERPHQLASFPGIVHIPVRASGRALVWNKESLLQIGLHRLPAEARYIGTFDTDIEFENPNWA